MSAKDNIQLAKRWFQEVWNEGRMETVRELLSANAVIRGQTGADVEIHGPDQFLPFVQNIRSAFPDIRVTIEDSFGARDRVVLRWSATMTHTGNGLGVAATGKPVRLTGITIARIQDGKFVEGWDSWDRLAMLQQIGAYQPPETSLLAKSA